MKKSTKIIILWGIILFGLTFHSLIELIPLFFGESIAMPDTPGTMPESMAWMSLIFYLLPMLCIVGVLHLSSAWVKITNLVLASLFTLLNLFHFLTEGLNAANAIQPILLIFILFSSVLLFIASLHWKRESRINAN